MKLVYIYLHFYFHPPHFGGSVTCKRCFFKIGRRFFMGCRFSPPRPVLHDQSFQNTVFIDVFWLVNINFKSCNELIFEFGHDLWSRFWSRFELSPVHLFVKVRYENIPYPKEIWFFWLLPFPWIYSKGPHRSFWWETRISNFPQKC